MGYERRRRAHLTPDEDSAIAAAYEAGEPIASIRKRFAVTTRTVYLALRRLGVEPTRNLQRSWKIETDEIVRLHTKAGLSVLEIAERFDVPKSTVYSRLAKAGCAVHSGPPARGYTQKNRRVDPAAAMHLRASGWSLQEVGHWFGVTGSAVCVSIARWRKRNERSKG